MATTRYSWPILVIVALVIVSSAVACGGSGSGEGTVQGTVTRARDPSKPLTDPSNAGDPIANAQVVAYSLKKAEEVTSMETFVKGTIVYKGFADANGAISFKLPAGKYVIEVWVNALEVGSRQVEVKSDKTTAVNLNVVVP